MCVCHLNIAGANDEDRVGHVPESLSRAGTRHVRRDSISYRALLQVPGGPCLSLFVCLFISCVLFVCPSVCNLKIAGASDTVPFERVGYWANADIERHQPMRQASAKVTLCKNHFLIK